MWQRDKNDDYYRLTADEYVYDMWWGRRFGKDK